MKEKNNNSYLVIDERMRKIEKEKLKELGFYLIEINSTNNVYEEISSHVDIFACQIGNKLIVEPSVYKLIKEKLLDNYNIEQGKEKVKDKYPADIKYM